jgi:putative superfamily III holin-X
MSAAKKLVTDKVNSIIGREVERATTEVKKKLRAVGLGIGLLVVAAVLAVFGLGLALATSVAALATVVSTWLALLIVTGGVLVLAGVLVAVGIRSLSKKPTPVGGLPSPRP